MKSAGNGAFLVSGASPYAPAMHLDHARRAASSVPICLSIAIIARSARAGAARLLVPAPRAQRNDQRRVIAARLNSLRDNLPRAPHIAHGDKDPIGSSFGVSSATPRASATAARISSARSPCS
jgi:hypothetical protein